MEEFESHTDAATGNALTFSQTKEQPSSQLIRKIGMLVRKTRRTDLKKIGVNQHLVQI